MKKLIYVVILVLLAFSVVAPKPVTTTQVSGELVIQAINNEFFVKGIESKLHWHTFNSTGYIKTNSSVNCTIHIYNNSGNHILAQQAIYDSNSIDFYVTLTTNLTNTINVYPYTIWCVDTINKQAGFIASEYLIANNTYAYDIYKPIAYLFLILIVIFALFKFSSELKDESEENENSQGDGFTQPLKLFLNLIAMFLIILAAGFGLKLLQIGNIPDSLNSMATWFYVICLFIVVPVLLLFLFRFLVALMQFMRLREKKKGGGWS